MAFGKSISMFKGAYCTCVLCCTCSYCMYVFLFYSKRFQRPVLPFSRTQLPFVSFLSFCRFSFDGVIDTGVPVHYPSASRFFYSASCFISKCPTGEENSPIKKPFD